MVVDVLCTFLLYFIISFAVVVDSSEQIGVVLFLQDASNAQY